MAPLLRELWASIQPSPFTVAAMTLGVVAYAASHAALAFSAGSLARSLGAGSAQPVSAVTLSSLLYVSLVAARVKAATGAGLAYGEELASSHAGAHLRTRLLAALLASGASTPASHLVAALGIRVREVELSISRGVLTWIRAALQVVPLAFCLVALSPASALGASAALLPFAIFVAGLRRHLRRAIGAAQGLSEGLARSVDELVRHADLFRSYGAGGRVLSEVVDIGQRAGRSAAAAEARRAALSGGNEVLGALSILAAVQLAPRVGWEVDGSLLPFATVFFMAYRPLRDLGDASSWVTRGEVALHALEEALRPGPAPPISSPRRTPVSWGPPRPVELCGYGARDRGPRTDLCLSPGEIVCLVGPTGAGKTTLLRALLGLEDETGTLEVGGLSLGGAPAGPGSRPFAWVPQEAPLVTGTLEDNVALFGASRASAREALEQVGASALLEGLRDARIGPGGRSLSGGERRLVALARAIASDLPVLLLDEPTEGLDPRATTTVLEAISRLRGSRSVLVVTHRDEVMRIASRIVTLGAVTTSRAAAE